MNRRLNDYLDKKGAKALDEGILQDYATTMKERTIPEIEREAKKNEERAAEMRFSRSPASKRQKVIASKKRKGVRRKQGR